MWSRRLAQLTAARTTGVDTADIGAFRKVARRTRVVRVGLACAAVALLVAAASSARSIEAREEGLLPSGTTGVAVVDLSLSIADEDYNLVRRALRRLIAEDAPVGLVVFSDVPYELLPPGTPASEIRPMLRLLVPPAYGPPINPWTDTFRAGTRISTALELAKSMLERDGVAKGAILLVSDLETAPDDVPQLARTVEDIRRSAIELRVVGLGPSSDALTIFQGLLQEDAFAVLSDPASGDEPNAVATSRFPWKFVLLGALFLIMLAAHERYGGRLALPAVARTRETA